jgi:hypothetical protein
MSPYRTLPTATCMEALAPHKGTAAGTSPKWLNGCAIALLVLTILVGIGLWALSETFKGLDGYGQLEKPGASGSVADPLGPGATARFEDGLKVTVSPARREPDATYAFAITYQNGTDELLQPRGDSTDSSVSECGPAPVVIRAGSPWRTAGPPTTARARGSTSTSRPTPSCRGSTRTRAGPCPCGSRANRARR